MESFFPEVRRELRPWQSYILRDMWCKHAMHVAGPPLVAVIHLYQNLFANAKLETQHKLLVKSSTKHPADWVSHTIYNSTLHIYCWYPTFPHHTSNSSLHIYCRYPIFSHSTSNSSLHIYCWYPIFRDQNFPYKCYYFKYNIWHTRNELYVIA